MIMTTTTTTLLDCLVSLLDDKTTIWMDMDFHFLSLSLYCVQLIACQLRPDDKKTKHTISSSH